MEGIQGIADRIGSAATRRNNLIDQASLALLDNLEQMCDPEGALDDFATAVIRIGGGCYVQQNENAVVTIIRHVRSRVVKILEIQKFFQKGGDAMIECKSKMLFE